MTYQLPPDLNDRVQSQLALGLYTTPAEVLTSALDALDERNRERRAIQEGIDAWRAGDKTSTTSTPNSAPRAASAKMDTRGFCPERAKDHSPG